MLKAAEKRFSYVSILPDTCVVGREKTSLGPGRAGTASHWLGVPRSPGKPLALSGSLPIDHESGISTLPSKGRGQEPVSVHHARGRPLVSRTAPTGKSGRWGRAGTTGARLPPAPPNPGGGHMWMEGPRGDGCYDWFADETPSGFQEASDG